MMRKTYIKMTDEKFIEWLRKISENCVRHSTCTGCPFITNTKDCQVELLTEELNRHYPNEWNMEEIERIIRL